MELLLRTALLLPLLLRGRGSEHHSLRHLHTGVSESCPRLRPFTSVGFVDGRRSVCFDSEEGKVKSGVEKVDQEDPQHWDRQSGGTVNGPPQKHQRHQVEGTVGGSVSLLLDLMPGEMGDKSHLDFQPRRGEGLELAVFMGGQWKRSESPDRFGQRLDLANVTAVRITSLEMEDGGLFKVTVRLPLARIWYQTFNLTVYGTAMHPPRKHQWSRLKGTVGSTISLVLDLLPGEMGETSHLDFQPQHGEGLRLAVFTGDQWKRSESPDRFGQRLDLNSETLVRIRGLEVEDSGLFTVTVRLPLARIWYQTFNLTVQDSEGRGGQEGAEGYERGGVLGKGSSVHSMRNFLTGVLDPDSGMPTFVAVNCVDGQCFERYDSHTRRFMPIAPWMKKVTEEDPHYWDRYTKVLWGWEATFRWHLSTLRERYNQSGGLHTLQVLLGCDLNEDLTSRGHYRYGYQGRDFITFDQETLTWTAADAAALIITRSWEADPAVALYWKNFLEEYIDWLWKFLHYGKQSLLRREPPAVKVTRKDSWEGWETLLCQAHGFYPKELDLTWRKDGQARQEDTFHGVVSPNSDGTYYYWISVEIDPKDRSRFRCHVEHDALQDPLDVAVEEPVPVWIIMVGGILGVLVSLAVAGIILYLTKKVCPALTRNPDLG